MSHDRVVYGIKINFSIWTVTVCVDTLLTTLIVGMVTVHSLSLTENQNPLRKTVTVGKEILESSIGDYTN